MSFRVDWTRPFRTSGRWWLPTTPENHIAGTLEFNPGEPIQLTLADALDVAGEPVIYGETGDGSVTLFDPILVRRTFNQAEHTFEASAFVLHHLIDKTYLTTIKKLRFCIWGVAENLREKPWAIDWKRVGEKDLLMLSLETERHVFTIQLPTDQTKLELHLTTPLNTSNDTFSATPTTWITVSPVAPQPLQYYEQIWTQLELFVSAMIGTRAVISAVEIGEDDDFATDGGPMVLVKQAARPPAVDPSRFGSLLYDARQSDSLAAIVQRWLESFDRHRVPMSHLLHIWDASGPLLESRFLSAVQAIEAFHRRSPMKQTFVSESEYQRIRSAMVQAFPLDTDKPLKTAMGKRLEFGNELSLRRRLKELVRHVGKDKFVAFAPSFIGVELDDWIKRVIDLRNEYVHAIQPAATSSTKTVEMHGHMGLLAFFVHRLILTDVGVSESSLDERLPMMPAYRDPVGEAVLRRLSKARR